MRGWRPSRPNSGLNEQRLSHFCDRDSLAHFPLIVNKIAVFWKEFLLCPPLCAVKTVEFDMRCGSMRFWREHFLSVPARRTMLLYDSPRFRVLSTALRVPRGSLPVRLQPVRLLCHIVTHGRGRTLYMVSWEFSLLIGGFLPLSIFFEPGCHSPVIFF